MFAAATIVLFIPLVVQGNPGPHATGETPVNDKDHIDRVNSFQGMTWRAGYNNFFDGKTFNDAKMLLGTIFPEADEVHPVLNETLYATIRSEDIPKNFDSRVHWPNLIHPIRNQQHCGSCWAFSASEVLSDRFAIAKNSPSPVLSPEDMVSCDKRDHGCNGGQLNTAWVYLQKTGIVTDNCFPYTAGAGKEAACARKCVDSESFTKYKASTIYSIRGVENMQKDIMTNGPIQTAFLVYKSFMSYQSGVYAKHPYELKPEGGHAVKIIGWGTEESIYKSVDYWLIANSWSTGWGLNGLFKIARGTNECGIEKIGPPYAGKADITTEIVI